MLRNAPRMSIYVTYLLGQFNGTIVAEQSKYYNIIKGG